MAGAVVGDQIGQPDVTARENAQPLLTGLPSVVEAMPVHGIVRGDTCLLHHVYGVLLCVPENIIL